jgi:hypothetical protein
VGRWLHLRAGLCSGSDRRVDVGAAEIYRLFDAAQGGTAFSSSRRTSKRSRRCATAALVFDRGRSSRVPATICVENLRRRPASRKIRLKGVMSP